MLLKIAIYYCFFTIFINYMCVLLSKIDNAISIIKSTGFLNDQNKENSGRKTMWRDFLVCDISQVNLLKPQSIALKNGHGTK